MVQAALTPRSDNQEFAIVWMRDFFSRYGDQSPNREETLLQLMQRKDVYEIYKADFIKLERTVLSYTRFNSLWHVIFPFCRIRYTILSC
jgi:hypothetical protein